ncbi:MAG: hypothetical protein U9P07_11665 [Pseudomonadota bacterium]|nr:hypothetical protein [Pseudomonadota bacterium]
MKKKEENNISYYYNISAFHTPFPKQALCGGLYIIELPASRERGKDECTSM